jgi:peptidoglycan/LPS O-acetylase OafA/YrhL
VLAFARLVVVLAASKLLERVRWLAFLGRASMTIFVLHVLFSAGARIAINQLTSIDPLMMLVITSLAGVLGPVLVYGFVTRVGGGWWLGLGVSAPGKPLRAPLAAPLHGRGNLAFTTLETDASSQHSSSVIRSPPSGPWE